MIQFEYDFDYNSDIDFGIVDFNYTSEPELVALEPELVVPKPKVTRRKSLKKKISQTCVHCNKSFASRPGKHKHVMNHCPEVKKVDLGDVQSTRKKPKTKRNEEPLSMAIGEIDHIP